ncbi:hypothetical protein CSIM01_09579 [Colletotrichum simmondsii]|uniref:Uncharacterized protein n=1 Tax=Colletotrichum simmondsii TaxID=703756 RepID=A0A135T3C9_9PEZI|nr:hypothetical protein CSIM01_09579 [Colletotrichum simmondsii]
MVSLRIFGVPREPDYQDERNLKPEKNVAETRKTEVFPASERNKHFASAHAPRFPVSTSWQGAFSNGARGRFPKRVSKPEGPVIPVSVSHTREPEPRPDSKAWKGGGGGGGGAKSPVYGVSGSCDDKCQASLARTAQPTALRLLWRRQKHGGEKKEAKAQGLEAAETWITLLGGYAYA